MKTLPSCWSSSILIALISLALLCGTAASVAAQRVIPSDTIDQTDQDDDEGEDRDSPYDSFDDVTVKRVSPGDLQDFQSGLPRGAPSRMNASDLPRSMRGEQMTELSNHSKASTIEIVAVQRPPAPYRSTDMIYRGHALWISASESGEDPVLVTTADWLKDAEEIYAVDGEVSRALSRGGLQTGDQASQPLADFKADAGDVLARHRSNLVSLEVDKADIHVNLAKLRTIDDEELDVPDTGFVIHDMGTMMPGTIFGYSPAIGDQVTPVGYQSGEDLELEYSFYFLVGFKAILGAPIIGSNGSLLAISALRYPTNPEFSLAIPPGAIHAFLETGRADADDDD